MHAWFTRMTSLQMQAIGQLQGVNQNLVAIYGALTAAEEASLESGCQHPEALRVSLATPRDPDHWVCSACRYEHQGLIRQ